MTDVGRGGVNLVSALRIMAGPLDLPGHGETIAVSAALRRSLFVVLVVCKAHPKIRVRPGCRIARRGTAGEDRGCSRRSNPARSGRWPAGTWSRLAAFQTGKSLRSFREPPREKTAGRGARFKAAMVCRAFLLPAYADHRSVTAHECHGLRPVVWESSENPLFGFEALGGPDA